MKRTEVSYNGHTYGRNALNFRDLTYSIIFHFKLKDIDILRGISIDFNKLKRLSIIHISEENENKSHIKIIEEILLSANNLVYLNINLKIINDIEFCPLQNLNNLKSLKILLLLNNIQLPIQIFYILMILHLNDLIHYIKE